MSFSLDVFVGDIPPELPAAWARALEARGLAAAVHPSFQPSTWRGGWLPWRVLVTTGAAPSGQYPSQYPSHPVAAGFELDVAKPEAEAAEAAPDDVRQVVAGAVRVFHLSTSAGRTAADLRLQCMAAATLAEVTGGVVYDPQQDAYFSGEAAIKNAKQEADTYEADSDAAAWNLEAWASW